MVYQFSEKNQIFIALFAIVVLCAGKLFKDYLFRQGYVEGFITSTVSDVRLVRPYATATAADLDFTTYFRIKMPELLAVITVQLPNNTSDVTLSANASDYTLHTVNPNDRTTTPLPLAVSNPVYTAYSAGPPAVPRKIVFTASNSIAAGTIVQIGVKGTLIKKTQTNPETFGPFTVTIGSSSSDSSITISPNTGPDAYSGANSAQALQNAITTIDARMAGLPPGDERRIELQEAKSALVTVMAYTYGTIKSASGIFESDALYTAQQTAIDFIAKEKTRAASNATTLKEDNSNKRRMAQVNTYYTRNYEANIDVMKNIIFVSIALILLAVLRNKDLLPPSISTLGVIFVLTLGGIVIGQQVFDIIRRNDHDFDKYDWNFNEKEYNDKQFIQQNSDTMNLSDMGMASCYGPGCCDVGTRWDSTAKKCMPGAGGSVSGGSAVWTSAAGGTLTITFKVPGGLAIAASPIVADTVTITLPSGLFSGTPALSGNEFSINDSPTVSAPLIFTKITSAVAPSASASTTITITGLAVSANAYFASKQLTVRTSKDINTVGINITGIP